MGENSRYSRQALTASMAGYAVDGFDTLILGFLLPAIAADLHLTSSQAGLLMTATLLGAVIGGVAFGLLSDRFGRMKLLKASILLFACATGLCALAPNYESLLALRLLCGFGLGGEFGIGMALASETCPAEKRAQMTSYVALGWQVGVLLAALVTPVLLPSIGWRGLFALGLLPALLTAFLRHLTQEPAIFTQHLSASRTALPLKLLVKDAATIRMSLGVWILCAVQNFGYFGLMVWLPAILSSRLSISLTHSILWTVTTILGMACGIFLFGRLADRLGRKPAFLLFQAGAAGMVLCYAQAKGAGTLLILGAGMGVFVNGMIGGYGALISELYPTEARATAQNTLFNLGRAVGGLGPPVVGWIATCYSFQSAVFLLAAIYLVDMAVTAILIPETRQKALV